jgi:Mitochondrial import 2
MSTSDSYILQDAPPESSNDQDEVDSLSSSIVSNLDSEEESDAQKEWEASLQQLELLLTMVLVPYIGKYFGRKCAYWSKSSAGKFELGQSLIMGCLAGWAKYMEWMYPVEVRYTSTTTFKATGAVVAAATL